MRNWLTRTKGGNKFLSGVEAFPWEESEDSDLVALSNRHHDTFMRWVSEKLVPWSFFKWFRRSRKSVQGHEDVGLVEWSERRYRKASMALSVVASSLIPGAAIVTLYHVHDLLARIYAAFVFSALFSLALALLTIARPAEILAATAA